MSVPAQGAAGGRRPEEGIDPAAVLLALWFIALFMVTGLLTRQFEEHERVLAASFTSRGDAALRQGRAEDAVTAYRDALFYARHDADGQFRLARALLASGKQHEARPYLEALWRQDPTNGVVNLELARLDAAHGAGARAIRHYQGAVHGVWQTDGDALRKHARRELIAFLHATGDTRRALAEVVALASSLADDDRAGHTEAGGLFLKLGDPRQALRSFRQALSVRGDDAGALVGAGQSAIALGEWRVARNYLRRVPAARRDTAVQRQLDLAAHVVDLDPWAPRISLTERGRRARSAVAAARARLDECVPGADPDGLRGALEAADRALRPHALRRTPDGIDRAFEAALAAEERARLRCGTGQPVDEAVIIIGRRRPGAEDDGDAR